MLHLLAIPTVGFWLEKFIPSLFQTKHFNQQRVRPSWPMPHFIYLGELANNQLCGSTSNFNPAVLDATKSFSPILASSFWFSLLLSLSAICVHGNDLSSPHSGSDQVVQLLYKEGIFCCSFEQTWQWGIAPGGWTTDVCGSSCRHAFLFHQVL